MDAHFPQWGKGSLCNFGDASRQEQPKGKDLVLICLPFEGKMKKQPVPLKNRDMEVLNGVKSLVQYP